MSVNRKILKVYIIHVLLPHSLTDAGVVTMKKHVEEFHFMEDGDFTGQVVYDSGYTCHPAMLREHKNHGVHSYEA